MSVCKRVLLVEMFSYTICLLPLRSDEGETLPPVVKEF